MRFVPIWYNNKYTLLIMGRSKQTYYGSWFVASYAYNWKKSWPIHYKKGPSNFSNMGPWAHTLLLLGNTLCKSIPVFCLGFFCRARRPAPFSWRPALLKKPKWRSALLTKKKKFSHTWLLALFCPFCCPHTAWIVLCIFYWAIQGHF